MDLRFVQSFVAVVELGSMAEAARQLDLTPSAVAARVHALEDELGTSLIQRAGRSVKPTESGLRILDRARSVLLEVRDLRTVARNDTLLGELKLGVFVSAMTSLLPPVLKGLYEKYPQLEVLVTPGNSVELCRQVGNGELDAAFVVEPQFTIHKSSEWRSLMAEQIVLVVPSGWANADPLELLRTKPYIRYDRKVLGGQLAERYLKDQGIRPQPRLEMDGLMAIAYLVAQEIGVSLLPDWPPLWGSSLPIKRIKLPGRAPVRHVGLIWAKNGPRVSLVKQVLSLSEELVRKTPAKSLNAC